MKCKWGEKPDHLKTSSAWLCMFNVPLAIVAQVGRVGYDDMEINEVLCTKEKCRCFQPKPADIILSNGSKVCGVCGKDKYNHRPGCYNQ